MPGRKINKAMSAKMQPVKSTKLFGATIAQPAVDGKIKAPKIKKGKGS